MAPINAVARDSLSMMWNDPATTPAETMFHDVVVLAGDACTFETGYITAAERDYGAPPS